MTRIDRGDLARRSNHDEDLKVPAQEGRAPRPATEPDGHESAARMSKTATDPVTGEPRRRVAKP
jgi:hypothetical protein